MCANIFMPQMDHKVHIFFLVSLLWIITISNATYTSEERSDNTKSLYSATHSVLGSTENNHQYHKHIHDNPPVHGYFNEPQPHPAYHVDGSERYYNGIASSGGISGGFGERTSSDRVFTNGPVPNAISSSSGLVGDGGGLVVVPCSDRNCGSESYYNNVASGSGISGGRHAAENTNGAPYFNDRLEGVACPGTGVTCYNRGGNTARSETEEIDYPKPPVGTFDPTVTGKGHIDARPNLRSPSTRSDSVRPGLPNNYNGYAPPTSGYAPPTAGYNHPTASYVPSTAGNAGYHPYYAYPTHVVGSGGYDSSVQSGSGSINVVPHYPGVIPTPYYPTPHTQGAYIHQQPPLGTSPHENGHGYHGNRGGYSTLDHTLKTNSEYNENGHHVGYFQAPNTGYGYNGAFNRPVF